ncbi:YceI family protein [Streptomyces sp. NPDC002589]|uniref:YceI family protein n=1 Tax=Streptomyces sp. NPDC002589 TaxID=3154420 RepID=UPI003317CCB6
MTYRPLALPRGTPTAMERAHGYDRQHRHDAPRLGRYTIDTDSSSLSYKSRHLFGLLPVRGTFAIRGGTVEVTEPLSGSRVHAEIDAVSLRTGNARRDATVRSAKFLDTDRYR